MASGEPGPFGNIHQLRNHWSGPARPRAYYWYLTFADAPEVCSLAAQSQQALTFRYYDPVAPQGLHMSLDRIAVETGITTAELNAIETAASRACQDIPPFRITLGPLSGTRGAVGFTVSPAGPIRRLREALRAATLSVCPDAPVVGQETAPHITIAYGNTDNVPAADAIAAVEKLNASGSRAEAAVKEVTLVLLERRHRSYAWQLVSRIPLTGVNWGNP